MGCGSYTFVVWDTSKKIKLSLANAWNAAKRYAKASIDKDGLQLRLRRRHRGRRDHGHDYEQRQAFESQLVALASFNPSK